MRIITLKQFLLKVTLKYVSLLAMGLIQVDFIPMKQCTGKLQCGAPYLGHPTNFFLQVSHKMQNDMF